MNSRFNQTYFKSKAWHSFTFKRIWIIFVTRQTFAAIVCGFTFIPELKHTSDKIYKRKWHTKETWLIYFRWVMINYPFVQGGIQGSLGFQTPSEVMLGPTTILVSGITDRVNVICDHIYRTHTTKLSLYKPMRVYRKGWWWGFQHQPSPTGSRVLRNVLLCLRIGW